MAEYPDDDRRGPSCFASRQQPPALAALVNALHYRERRS